MSTVSDAEKAAGPGPEGSSFTTTIQQIPRKYNQFANST